MTTFKYVCIQLIRFLPIPFLIILLAVGGMGVRSAFESDQGGSGIVMTALLLIVVGAYLGLFFGLRLLARKYTPRSRNVEATTAIVSNPNRRNFKSPRASMQSFRDENKMFKTLAGEEWILEAQARLSVKMAGIPAGGAPGFVSVSNKRVVFEPARTSVTRATAEILLDEVVEVKRTWNAFVFPNSLEIITRGGDRYKITTWSRNAISKLIEDSMSGP